MPEYKLCYFNLRGRCELSRLLFHYAAQEFEDFRFGFEDWPALKPTMLFQQAPVLEVDGQSLSQSNSIARYLARKFKLSGQTEMETALCDMYVDHIEDLQSGLKSFMKGGDPVKMKELGGKYLNEVLAPHVLLVEKQLKANGSGYLVGTGLTWADIAYYNFLSWVADVLHFDSLLSRAIHLKTLVKRVGDIPNIRNYVVTRPKTDY